jgi:DNA-binding transcriptional MerR regulator
VTAAPAVRVSTEHHTIGEVLNRLKAEFDDVTISKIRFLESEGLITPQRSDSGYRQFSTADVERLRYVLRAQRDRYLPLRVIKDELARLDAGLPIEVEPVDPPAVIGADGQPGPTTSSAALSDVSLDRSELAQAAGLTPQEMDELAEHGLIPRNGPYDGETLRIVRVAAELMRRGLDARHLRTYRLAAEREATLIEQRVIPLLRQRNPESRRRAASQVEELVELGSRLHGLMLERQLAVLRRP